MVHSYAHEFGGFPRFFYTAMNTGIQKYCICSASRAAQNWHSESL
jgi:hypothetical protein